MTPERGQVPFIIRFHPHTVVDIIFLYSTKPISIRRTVYYGRREVNNGIHRSGVLIHTIMRIGHTSFPYRSSNRSKPRVKILYYNKNVKMEITSRPGGTG